ncbi:MAG: HD domain-containing protein [bacterium]
MKKIPEMELSITKKLFRKRENWKKVLFILKQTNLDITIITAAASVARLNDFHNFGHQLGAAEMGIKIARAEKLTKAEITEIAFALLFHDASHRGIVQWYDEIRAIEAVELVISESDVKGFSKKSYTEFMTTNRNLILATTFSKHGETNNLYERIMQDADLAHLGQGPVYWLWASMGLIIEFNRQREKKITPIEFVRNEQTTFITALAKKGNGNVFLTEGARRIFHNPIEDVTLVALYNDKQIQFAFDIRTKDITVEEFARQLEILE